LYSINFESINKVSLDKTIFQARNLRRFWVFFNPKSAKVKTAKP